MVYRCLGIEDLFTCLFYFFLCLYFVCVWGMSVSLYIFLFLFSFLEIGWRLAFWRAAIGFGWTGVQVGMGVVRGSGVYGSMVLVFFYEVWRGFGGEGGCVYAF